MRPNTEMMKSFIGGMRQGLAMVDPNHEVHGHFKAKEPVNPQNPPRKPLPKIPMTFRKMGE